MIGTRTPFRISFAGGGSDLRSFYCRQPGCVLSTSINKYMYIMVHPFFDQRIQVKYSRTELVNSVAHIQHPIVRVALEQFKLEGIDINSIADIPAGTGLGSSCSFTVGLLHALYTYTGKYASKEQLAQNACQIEIEIAQGPHRQAGHLRGSLRRAEPDHLLPRRDGPGRAGRHAAGPEGRPAG